MGVRTFDLTVKNRLITGCSRLSGASTLEAVRPYGAYRRYERWGVAVNRGRMIAAARRYGPLVACLAVLALLAGGGSLVALPHRAGAPKAGAVLAPGAQGSLGHHPWWDPRGWFGGSGAPGPRTIAAAGGPQTGRKLAQVAAPPVRR